MGRKFDEGLRGASEQGGIGHADVAVESYDKLASGGANAAVARHTRPGIFLVNEQGRTGKHRGNRFRAAVIGSVIDDDHLKSDPFLAINIPEEIKHALAPSVAWDNDGDDGSVHFATGRADIWGNAAANAGPA